MNTTQLDCFMLVANFLNFSKAAEQLRLSQPAVSHQIRTLEDELGVRLFHRTSKSVRLTQEGHLFVQYASEILRLTGQSRARMQQAKKEVSKRLVIGCRGVVGLQLVRPVLEKLRQEDPAIVPDLRLLPFDSMENLLEDGDVHVMLSFGKGTGNKLQYQQLCRCRPVCVCSPSHALAGESQVTMAQLQQAGRIAVCRPPVCPPALFAVQTQVMGGRDPDQILFCDQQEVAFTLVQSGYAFALTVDFPHIRQAGMCYIPIADADLISFGVLYPARERRTARQHFLSLLTESLQAAGLMDI